MSNCLQYN